MSMTYYAVTDDPNELAHFGIKGMKWGVRHDKPRHTGSRRRSAAYKRAQSKLGQMMKSGIKKAEAHWKAYNSPKAKEERFMKKAMQQARTGTLKYGKLTDDQVRRVTDRLALERNARSLGSTENPTFGKRLRSAIGEGVIRGIGQGTASYIDERFKGRGRTDAEFKAEKRRAKFESDERYQRRKAQNKVDSEYYEEAAKRGYSPGWMTETAMSREDRAKQLQAWRDRDAREEERIRRQKNIHDTYDRSYAVEKAKANAKKRFGNTDSTNNSNSSGNTNGQKNPQLPVAINIYSGSGARATTRRSTNLPSTKTRTGRRTRGGRN